MPRIAAKLREPVLPQMGLDAEPDHLVPVVTMAAPGMPAEVRYVLEDCLSDWVVHYSKRGLESGLQCVAPEDLACRIGGQDRGVCGGPHARPCSRTQK